MNAAFFLFKMKAVPGDVHAFTRRSRGKFGGEGAAWPSDESWVRCDEFDFETVRAEMLGIPWASFEVKRAKDGRDAGIVARSEDGAEKPLFGMLLGVARLRGLSIAAPERGLLLGTPEDPEERAEAWMMLRKGLVQEYLQQAGGLDFFPFSRTENEWYCVAFHDASSKRPKSERAVRFRELLRSALYPDERLECHVGWLEVFGPGGVYRLSFNWEGRGKHASWIPDFRQESCPMVLSHRCAFRMALRTPKERSLVDVGMWHPVVVHAIPDPVDRFASLRLVNHRLTKRVPREVVEELKAAKAAANGTAPQKED